MQSEKRRIQQEIERALAKLSKMREMLKGSVSKVVLGGRKRGDGERASYLLTYKGEGNRTKTAYVAKDRVADARRMIGNYQKAKQSLEKIVELNVRLFKMK